MSSPSPQPNPPTMERRRLLNTILGTSVLGWLATILYPVVRYLSPLEEAVNADEAVLSDKSVHDVADAGFAIVPLGTERVLVFQDSRGKVRATSAKCTHEGCTVQYKADESVIWCACHNGRFDLDGRVLSGPPPRPLTVFKASGSLDTRIVVSRT
jgi:cytochrome b6-f complex iron-sulfur subunit